MPDQAHPPLPSSIDETISMLGNQDYLAGRALGTVLFLALKMKRPLFLEGRPASGRRRSPRSYQKLWGGR